MKKTIVFFFLLCISIALLIDTYSYNQMSMEESSIYKYHLWILVLTTPLLFVFLLFNIRWFKNIPLRTYFFFVIYIFILSLLHSIWGINTIVNWVLLLHIIYPFFCAALVYVAIEEKLLEIQKMINFSIILWILFVLIFLLGWTTINSVFNFTVRGMNNVYHILFALPFCLCSKSKLIRTITTVLTGLFCVISMKRGAMIGFGIMLMIYYIFNIGTKGIHKLFTLLVIGIMIIGAYVYLDNISGNYVTSRFELQNAGDDSREMIYKGVIDALQKSSLSELIIGHGSTGVKDITEHELSAHNDFLEIIFDYGIIALIAWVLLLFFIFREGVRKNKARNPHGTVLLSSLGIVLISCTFSHFFFMSYSCILMLFWGAVLSKNANIPTNLTKKISNNKITVLNENNRFDGISCR